MSHQKNILILGAYGFLGRRLSFLLKEKGYNILRHGRGDEANFKIEEFNTLHKKIKQHKIDSVINLVAATDVDKCERNINFAFDSNIFFIQNVVNEILKIKENQRPHLVHISTDQVYQGNGPHLESSARPLNVYALTKFSSELIALTVQSTILRTNFIGRNDSNKKDSLSDFIIKSLRSGKQINVFNDVYFNPLFIDTLCEIVELSFNTEINGIYNVGSCNGLSKSQFAFSIAEKLSLNKDLMREVSVNSMNNLDAKRPLDMRMNCSAFLNKVNYKLPDLDAEIIKLINDYK